MRMGQGVRTGLGYGGITCVLQTQFSSFFFQKNDNDTTNNNKITNKDKGDSQNVDSLIHCYKSYGRLGQSSRAVVTKPQVFNKKK